MKSFCINCYQQGRTAVLCRNDKSTLKRHRDARHKGEEATIVPFNDERVPKELREKELKESMVQKKIDFAGMCLFL